MKVDCNQRHACHDCAYPLSQLIKGRGVACLCVCGRVPIVALHSKLLHRPVLAPRQFVSKAILMCQNHEKSVISKPVDTSKI